MAQQLALGMGDPTDLSIYKWISEACNQPVGPVAFPDVLIALGAAFPRAKDLEGLAWLESTVCFDHYGQLIGCGPKFNQWPTPLQETQWTNARKAPSPDRLRFPAAGPLGSPFAIQPPPVLPENQTPVTGFEVTQTPETFSSLPDVQIPVT